MIVLDDVSYSYDGRTPALDGVSLRIPDGEFLCILGGNGSGKSTLAKHLNALLVPDAGTVLVDGIDTSDPEYVYDVRARVGYVFQNPDDQLVATLVADDVAFGPENLGLDPALIGERCEESLDEVGLTGFGRREAHALSGGQKQRVAIAGVLAMHPEVLVLDEASSMLDPRGRAGLMRVCRELHGQGIERQVQLQGGRLGNEPVDPAFDRTVDQVLVLVVEEVDDVSGGDRHPGADYQNEKMRVGEHRKVRRSGGEEKDATEVLRGGDQSDVVHPGEGQQADDLGQDRHAGFPAGAAVGVPRPVHRIRNGRSAAWRIPEAYGLLCGSRR